MLLKLKDPKPKGKLKEGKCDSFNLFIKQL